MINSFIEGMDNNSKIICLVILALVAVSVLKITYNFLFYLFHGHPPAKPTPLSVIDKRQDCYEDNNLTQKCLRSNGCQTQQQCEHTVQNWMTKEPR